LRSLTSTGTVQGDHSQFTIGSAEVDTLDTQTRGSLLEIGPGFATTVTGTTYGPAHVTLSLLDQPPAEPGNEWESSKPPRSAPAGRSGSTSSQANLPTASPRSRPATTTYAPARGRDIATSTEVTDPTEQYPIELWSHPAIDNDTSVVVTVHQTDRAWPVTDESEPVSQPDTSGRWVRDKKGKPIKVTEDSDPSCAALDDLRLWFLGSFGIRIPP